MGADADNILDFGSMVPNRFFTPRQILGLRVLIPHKVEGAKPECVLPRTVSKP